VIVSSLSILKKQKRAIISQGYTSDNGKGLTQVFTTLVPLAALWFCAVSSAGISLWLTAGVTVLISLFLVRAFVLMHECGHGSLFRTAWLNQAFGFLFGVLAGMPQFVWARHHAYHHATNGDWERYRGALNILTVDEFRALSANQQRFYLLVRNIWMAPLGGFVYLIFNPRFTWLAGSLRFLGHLLKGKLARPSAPLSEVGAQFKTRYWKDSKEYWHMFWNNAVVLSLWALTSWAIGPSLFFSVYLCSVSLAGGVGLVVFTVQHNFEHSYATDSEAWDGDAAAIQGTSFLDLPRWLGWFTANIAYHHIHHLSSRIPNYWLAKCHNENRELFSGMTRIRLRDIPHALKCILWDVHARRIIAMAEYRQQAG
jgi:acyl-lipid omega-6 desaturase (Delta-12 desaturase)